MLEVLARVLRAAQEHAAVRAHHDHLAAGRAAFQDESAGIVVKRQAVVAGRAAASATAPAAARST